MKKRLMLSLMTVALVALLASGATFALFTATATNASNTFTSGTVALGTPATTTVNVTDLAPGDSGTFSYTVQYTGSLDAFLGLDTAQTGNIWTVSSSYPFAVSVSGNGKTFALNQTNQLIGKFSQNDSITISGSYNLPLNAGNEYQGKTGTLSLTVHAVQAKNNTNNDYNGDGTTGDEGPLSW